MKLFLLNILSLAIFLAILGSFSSCREEIDMDVTDTTETLPVELINTNISGQVTNMQGKELEGANIRILDKENLSDENGYFMFEDIKADRNGTVLVVTKSGYLENRVTVYPSLNHDLFSSIILTEDNSSASMLSWQGGTVVLGEYGSLHIFPNTLVYDHDGSNFEGTAEIKFQLYEPEHEAFELMLPGDLTGYVGQTRKALIPASAVRISITDGKLNKLRLAREQKAELVLKASGKYQTEWLDDVKIYRYDTDQDKWLNKGVAVNSGDGNFIGEISDFGNILFGNDHNVVKLEGSLSYDDQGSTARHQVELSSEIQQPSMRFTTDEQGHFTAWIPENKELYMEISNECGVKILEEEIGSLSDDTNINRQMEASLQCKTIPVEGKLLDCDGNPVSEGYVRITSEENDLFVRTDKNGNYTGDFKICDEDITIDLSAFDMNSKYGTIRHEGYPVHNAIMIADWKVCPSIGNTGLQFLDRYFFLTDGISFVDTTPNTALLYLGESEEVYIDCSIIDFRGEDIYYIPSEFSAEFIVTVNGKTAEAPNLVPKDALHFWTYRLIVDHYVENEIIEGSITGHAKDTNNDDEDGMMFIKFSVPF